MESIIELIWSVQSDKSKELLHTHIHNSPAIPVFSLYLREIKINPEGFKTPLLIKKKNVKANLKIHQ